MLAESVPKSSTHRSPLAKPRFRLRLVFIVVASLSAARYLFFSSPGNVDFYSHKAQYDSVVQAVKSAGMVMPEESEWQVTRWGATPSLRWLKPGSISVNLAGRVSASRTKTVGYTISIVTSDQGHRGTQGYVYCDGELPLVAGDPYRQFDAPGDLCLLGRRINQHWWSAYNNLD